MHNNEEEIKKSLLKDFLDNYQEKARVLKVWLEIVRDLYLKSSLSQETPSSFFNSVITKLC